MTTDELKALLAKTTPGPWGFGRTSEDRRIILGRGGDGRYVANVQVHQTPRAYGLSDENERDANARLIAQAPALAAALIKAEEALIDATAHLVGAESAYREFAKRHQDIRPKAATDPFFTTRVGDFRKAADRARAAYLEISALTGENDD